MLMGGFRGGGGGGAGAPSSGTGGALATVVASTNPSDGGPGNQGLPAVDYDNTAKTLTGSVNGAVPTIDGHTVVVGERYIFPYQNNAIQSGVYVSTSLGSAGSKFVFTRASDANTSALLAAGRYWYVEQGSGNATSNRGKLMGIVNTSGHANVMGTDSIFIFSVAGLVTGSGVAGGTIIGMHGWQVTPANITTTLKQAPSTVDFSGTFNLDVARNFAVTFPAGWDGGDVTISDGDMQETFVAAPGTTVTGANIFQPSTGALTATHDTIGADAGNCLIKRGKKISIAALDGFQSVVIPTGASGYVGFALVDGVPEKAVITNTQGGEFSPTTNPDGTKVFSIITYAVIAITESGHSHGL